MSSPQIGCLRADIGGVGLVSGWWLWLGGDCAGFGLVSRALRTHERHQMVGGPQVYCKKCLVAGRVQGVFYRGTAARRAGELAVRGYARNLADGRVEVLACGEEEAVRT